MYRRLLLFLLLATIPLATANSAPLYVTTSARFSTTDVASPLVTPNGLFVLTFGIDSNPTPLPGTVSTLGFDLPVSNVSYTLNGSAVNAVPTEIRFSTAANGGLFDVTFGSGLSASVFSFQGVQAFTGSVNNPVFTIGTYAITSWSFSDLSNFDAQTPSGLSAAITPVPEPASITLLAAGGVLVLLGCLARSRNTSSKSEL